MLSRVLPYLRRLFPGGTVAVDEIQQIYGLSRTSGPAKTERLPDGTREQVAVLLRLAYADLLRKRGRPSMLILDDALS